VSVVNEEQLQKQQFPKDVTEFGTASAENK
jgi:hypothetical protein